MTHVFPTPATARKPNAFTLVELLVVIGIIALLISILLPSLNRAREAAKAVKCAANLHSLGNALQIYLQDNKGMCPIGFNNGTIDYKTCTSNGLTAYTQAAQKFQTNWALLLMNVIDRKLPTNVYDIGYNNPAGSAVSPAYQVLQCPTAPSAAAGLTGQLVYHYQAHPRIFMTFDMGNGRPTKDPATGGLWNTTKATRIKRSADMAVIFDGSLQYNASSNTMTTIYDQPDGGGLDYAKMKNNNEGGTLATTFLANIKPQWGTIDLQTPVNMMGFYNQPLIYTNTDTTNNQGNIRFRHGSNNTANALMFDGHVQSFRINKSGETDLLRRNLYLD